MEEEYFTVVDENDEVIGRATRSECHTNPSLIHRVAHVLVFTSAGELILQKRAADKDIQPGKWDTSVGGHCDEGEDYGAAAYREMEEELGIKGPTLTFINSYIMRSQVETESVHTFTCTYDGDISHHPKEIDEVRAWSMEDIKKNLGTGLFTPNFEKEFRAGPGAI